MEAGGIGTVNRVGFWSFLNDPKDQVDASWDETERAQVVAYLKAGLRGEPQFGSSYCRMGCYAGQMHSDMGSAERYDGEWVWPEGYVHYLEVHQVKPPEEFVRHVLLEIRKFEEEEDAGQTPGQ